MLPMGSPAPLMLDLRGAFLGPQGPALLARHERYGSALAKASGDPSAALSVAVPARLGRDIDEFAVGSGVHLISGIPQGNPRFWAKGRPPELSEAPTLWIAGDPFTTGPLQLAAARRTRSRLQVQAHGDFGVDSGTSTSRSQAAKLLVAQRVLARADSVRAVSDAQAESLVRRFKIDRNRVFVAPVPLDVAFTEASYVGVEREPRVLFVGRLHEERGLNLWAQTAALISRRHPDVVFDIVGSGPAEANFRSLLAGVPHISWHGSLPPSQVAELMSRSRVLLSTPPSESYGRSLSEALCMGLSVVATRTTGALRLDESAGVVVGDTAPELAEAVFVALDDSSPLSGSEKFRQTQRMRDDAAIDALVRSWLWDE